MNGRKLLLCSPCLYRSEEEEGAWSVYTSVSTQHTIWGSVGGCHDNHPSVQQCSEQLFEDHGITNVGHLELIKAQEVGISCNIHGNRADGIIRDPLVSTGWHIALEMMDLCRRG